MKDLLCFFKDRAGLLDIQLSADYVQNRPAPKYNFRSYDVNDISDIKCRTDYLKNSYFPRVIRKWSLLDSHIKSITCLDIFYLNFIRNVTINFQSYELPHKSLIEFTIYYLLCFAITIDCIL